MAARDAALGWFSGGQAKEVKESQRIDVNQLIYNVKQGYPHRLNE